jgi:hypothetical protein
MYAHLNHWKSVSEKRLINFPAPTTLDPQLFLNAVKVEVAHVPVSTTLEFEHVVGLARADLVIVKDEPIFVQDIDLTQAM